MASHASCGIHPPRRLEWTVLRRLPVGPVDQALEGGLRPDPLPQLPQLRVGPALPPRSTGGSVALGVGVGVGVGACGGVMGTGGGGGPGGVLVVLRRGGARGVDGARAYADTWIRGHGLCLAVGLGSMGAAVTGHSLDVGRHRGLVGGWGRCWLPLALLRPGRGGWPVGPGCGFWVVLG